MNDNELQQLFLGYDPILSDDDIFMKRLSANIETMKLVKKRNATYIRRSRIAMAISALIGILTGTLLTLSYPYIKECITGTLHHLHSSLPILSPAYTDQLPLIIIMLGTTIVSLASYDISMGLIAGYKASSACIKS